MTAMSYTSLTQHPWQWTELDRYSARRNGKLLQLVRARCACGTIRAMQAYEFDGRVRSCCSLCRLARERRADGPYAVRAAQRAAVNRCDHCRKPESFNVLCPDCELLVCPGCGRVTCCCDGKEQST